MGNYSLGLVVCFFVHSSSAYIYEVRVARRTMPDTNEKQYIIGLSDFHDRSQPRVATDQRTMFEKLLKTADTAKMRFLLEDLSSPNCEGMCSCGNYRVNTRGGFLGGITDVIKRHGFRADNLEFRYCRVVALGLAAAGNSGKHARALQEAIKIEQFIKETQNQLDAIGRYQDACMMMWYKSCTQVVETAMAKLALVGYKKQTVRDYLHAASQKNKQQEIVLEELLSYDSPLFDVRLAHEILNDERHKTVVVIAGGTHIREAFDALVKTGYEHVPVIQECFISKGAVGSNGLDAQNNFDVRDSQQNNYMVPRPIALTCSKRFWPQRNN